MMHAKIRKRIDEDPRGVWCTHDDHPVGDWQQEVAERNTLLGYHEWASHRQFQIEATTPHTVVCPI